MGGEKWEGILAEKETIRNNEKKKNSADSIYYRHRRHIDDTTSSQCRGFSNPTMIMKPEVLVSGALCIALNRCRRLILPCHV